MNFAPLRPEDLPQLMVALMSVLAVRGFSFVALRTYSGVVRYTSTEDAKKILFAVSGGTVALVIISVSIYSYLPEYRNFRIPISILLVEYFITISALAGYRVAIKILYSEIKNRNVQHQNIVIFGAGEKGLITKRTIDHDKDNYRKVVGFIDDDPQKRGKQIEGVKIFNLNEDLPELTRRMRIDELIISVQDISRSRKEAIVDYCVKFRIKAKAIPSAIDWVNGDLNVKQIADVKIEDLLQRAPIQLDQKRISIQLQEKVVLVTGASGSIGSELVRQIINFYPREIILVDQAETPLYELELELKEKNPYINCKFVVADVFNKTKMEKIIAATTPEIIYHAAAYKHVPLMEENPTEAVATNVGGTIHLADLAVQYNVDKFILVSTDKAVNPTNVMGASKRAAEIYVQSLNQSLKADRTHYTRFITTRFGNVLGSNGSVIPRFRKQIEEGGPVTVTHPEICRYFMTIPEACQLILEAGMMGAGGEIFVFDMGDPVKITDLAKRMIILSGMQPNKDINIVFTGLRPGEKIYEELLSGKETALPTYHSKILIGKVREYPYQIIKREIEGLLESVNRYDELLVVGKLKELIPEYVSNNSRFEELDKIVIPQVIEKTDNSVSLPSE